MSPLPDKSINVSRLHKSSKYKISQHKLLKIVRNNRQILQPLKFGRRYISFNNSIVTNFW